MKYYFISYSFTDSYGMARFGDGTTAVSDYPSRSGIIAALVKNTPFLKEVILLNIIEWTEEQYNAWLEQ